MKLLGLLSLTAFLLLECGGTTGSKPAPSGPAGVPGSTGSGARPPSPSPSPHPEFITSLDVTVTAEPGAPSTTATLRCATGSASSTGFIADAEAACRAVEEHRSALSPAPSDRACTMIYGGPQEAWVRGTAAGQGIDRRFTRSDGCGIADWKALQALLGPPPGEGEAPN